MLLYISLTSHPSYFALLHSARLSCTLGKSDPQLTINCNNQPILKTEHPPLQTFFRTPELQNKTSNKYINFYSSSRIDKLIGILITLIIFCLLVAPVVAMYRLSLIEDRGSNSTFDAVGVLVIFTLLFSAAMSLVTKAARHELFAASAAYCAILVVFIGNFSMPGN
jgi:hypothetical protein